ncbi:hypothetical protein Bca52824_011861 [Brassica carinata]|uniref:Jacalin-type lectin domain-containing protein n=1 Tax=Brassica carinata TaxID=52824 RepID=A0A8X7VUX8_BRACI|nr:hypothetical protein Bca52824_011861 [Brassica carinata]
MAQKLEAKGGKGGNQWDDLADHDNVTKIKVRGGSGGIQYVQFDYVRGGKIQTGSMHGVSGRGFTQAIEIDPNNEFLVSVEGYYDDTTGVIQALQFKTNKKTSELMGDDNGSMFSLEVNGKKIIGFHGYAGTNLNSLGAYFATAPPTKLDYQGGAGGSPWDDGPNYKGVRKVSVSLNNNEIRQIRVDYEKGGSVESLAHGEAVGQHQEFVVDFPTEYIISVEGTCDDVSDPYQNRVRSLVIKTSKNRTSPTFGNVAALKFVLQNNGGALIGFHGRAAGALDAIGAYFSAPVVPAIEKLQAKGGEGGDPWDDGVFNGVREIYVGQGVNGVVAVKFVYGKDSHVANGDEHGIPSMLEYEKFKLDYPSEYITSVEGCFDKILGSENGLITMLKFQTNKKTSPPYGMESASSFVLGKEGYKIVGFHGKSSHELHQLGVHVVPITQ